MTEHEIGIFARGVVRWTQQCAEPVAVYFSRKTQKVHKRPVHLLGDEECKKLIGVYAMGVTAEMVGEDVRAWFAERGVAA